MSVREAKVVVSRDSRRDEEYTSIGAKQWHKFRVRAGIEFRNDADFLQHVSGSGKRATVRQSYLRGGSAALASSLPSPPSLSEVSDVDIETRPNCTRPKTPVYHRESCRRMQISPASQSIEPPSDRISLIT